MSSGADLHLSHCKRYKAAAQFFRDEIYHFGKLMISEEESKDQSVKQVCVWECDTALFGRWNACNVHKMGQTLHGKDYRWLVKLQQPVGTIFSAFEALPLLNRRNELVFCFQNIIKAEEYEAVY